MIGYIFLGFGVLGVVFGVRCYYELWKWVKQVKRVRIAIAYNRRVQLDAPLSEWLEWGNSLGGKQRETGRVVYRVHKMSVAILRPGKEPATKVKTRKVEAE